MINNNFICIFAFLINFFSAIDFNGDLDMVSFKFEF